MAAAAASRAAAAASTVALTALAMTPPPPAVPVPPPPAVLPAFFLRAFINCGSIRSTSLNNAVTCLLVASLHARRALESWKAAMCMRI